MSTRTSSRPRASSIAPMALTLAAVAAAPLASAQLVLEEVIVTAQKREQSLQDVPISVTALDGTKLNDAGIQKIEELSAYIPNFNMTETAVGNTVFIRGIGSGINQGFDQSVGMFIDGIYAGRSQQFRAPFLDIAMVEVLKGPQGTLFGKNTIAGAINITTAKPTDELTGDISVLYEPEYETSEIIGVVSGGISDTVSARLAVKYRESDGYLDNLISDEQEPEREEQTYRASLLWTPGDNLDVLIKGETGEFDVDGRAVQVSNVNGTFVVPQLGISQPLAPLVDPRESGKVDDEKTAAAYLPEATDTKNDALVVTMNYDLGEYTLTSITGYSAYEFDELTDADFTDLTFTQQDIDQKFDQYSQELRLTSPIGDKFDYILGAYWQEQELENSGRIDFDLAAAGLTTLPSLSTYREFDQDASTYAVFGQGTWHLTQDWHLTFGLRWTREEKDARQSLVVAEFGETTPSDDPALALLANRVAGSNAHVYDDDRSSDDTSPSLTLTWDMNIDTMLYARIAQGFKSGGFNEAENTGVEERFEFDDEEALSYELGAKMTLLDGAATLNTALFYTEFDDRQVSAFEGLVFVVGNAAKSTTQGLEMDGRWLVTENFSMGLSLAYLDSTFDEFENAGCQALQITPGVDCSQDLSGEDTEFAPEWSSSINARYAYPIGNNLELVTQVDANYSDSYFYAQDLDPEESTDSYTKWNARLALGEMTGMWEVALIGKNLTDETVNAHGNDIPAFTGAHYVFTEPPRTIAVQGIWRF